MHTLIIGAGYSGRFIATEAASFGTVCGTRRTAEGVAELAALGLSGCVFDAVADERLLTELTRVTHLVVCVAPGREMPLSDPILEVLRPLLATAGKGGADKPFAALQWIGYLSTIGVYGDHGGGWVDETTPCTSTQVRSMARREAELAWQALATERQVPISVLRLSGIYGPGKNAVADAIKGRASMLIKPGQYFNRIHVQDLATAVIQAARCHYDGVLNITDDEPAAPQDVICHAHELVGKPAPEALAFDVADITPMARSFYSENKRVRNELGKRELQFDYRYPDFRAGLGELWQTLQQQQESME